MDFWDVARKMEQDGKKFYDEEAAKAPVAALAGVFRFLADEEQRHYDLFTAMQNNSSAIGPGASEVLVRAASAFGAELQKMKGLEGVSAFEEAYRKALDAENHAVAFYAAESGKVTDVKQKAVIAQIIEQEKQHVKLFEGLLDYVSRPQEWLESAEFNHFDQY